MHFDDLEKIIHLAHSQNIHISAKALNVTAGALSKTLKKTENRLNTHLFDRVGRNIQLNANGKKFINYALNLNHEYEQMCSEFTNKQTKYHLKVSGPAVLLDTLLATIMPLLPNNNTELTIDALYEGDAIKHLINGQSHIAIVTNEVLSDVDGLGLSSILLGTTTGSIVAGHQHEIFEDFPNGIVMMKDLLRYNFICPKASPFCGIERGIGSDGWLDHEYQRKIAYRSNDFNSLLSVVKHGNALAYVPNVIANGDDKLKEIQVNDFSNNYQEQYSLVYKPSTADGWLNNLIYRLQRKTL